MSDLFNKLLLLRAPRVGIVKYNELVARFGSVAEAAASLRADVELRDAVMREMDMAHRLGIKYVADSDAAYPKNLRDLKNHPPVITVRGNVDALVRPMVSIVGTRHATANGMGFIADIAHGLADNGVVVVSGMAIGTDTAAHRGALRSSGDLVTVAVLAGGADYVWPTENESLYWEIVERGAIVSERPVGFVPNANAFVPRNKWIAALGDKLILGEADIKSGSMTTARFAIDFGREIWAIPSHPADSRAMGPNSLIRSGAAQLCIGVSDFVKTNEKKSPSEKNQKKFDSDSDVLDAIGTIPVSESVLADVVKKSVSEIKAELVVLELQGFVRKVDGGYVRA